MKCFSRGCDREAQSVRMALCVHHEETMRKIAASCIEEVAHRPATNGEIDELIADVTFKIER